MSPSYVGDKNNTRKIKEKKGKEEEGYGADPPHLTYFNKQEKTNGSSQSILSYFYFCFLFTCHLLYVGKGTSLITDTSTKIRMIMIVTKIDLIIVVVVVVVVMAMNFPLGMCEGKAQKKSHPYMHLTSPLNTPRPSSRSSPEPSGHGALGGPGSECCPAALRPDKCMCLRATHFSLIPSKVNE